MQKKDKIKLIVVSILIVMIATTYLVFGKESIVMKSMAGFSLVFWIVTMIYLNKRL
ncbi:MAG: hypothetical protein HYU68_02580 [Bacteroidetes bacterium]|nr:hypothetical protein [Bacteroidota bacterium]